MADTSSVSIAAITLAGTIAAGFFTMVNKQNKTHEKLSDTMVKLADSGEAQAKATKEGFDRLVKTNQKGNAESKERNGHLGEASENIARMLQELSRGNQQRADKNHKELTEFMGSLHKKLGSQEVKEQVVKHQTVTKAIIEQETKKD